VRTDHGNSYKLKFKMSKPGKYFLTHVLYTKTRLAAGLCPDPLGKLNRSSMLPTTLSKFIRKSFW